MDMPAPLGFNPPMGARGSRPPVAEGRLPLWVAVAAALHLAGLAGSARRPRETLPLDEPGRGPTVALDIAAPLTAAIAKAPPPPPPPPRLAPVRGQPLVGVLAPSLHRAPTPATGDDLRERLGKVVAALAAEASRILTTPDGRGPPMATGNAEAAHGRVAGNGEGTTATFDPRAAVGGGRGGGSGPGELGPDRSRGPSVRMGYNPDCDFPSEADAARVDHGWAMLIVTVAADGRAPRVKLLDDSGHGFGRVAVICALEARYQPALDRTGKPVEQDTPAFRYRFTR